MPRVAQQAVPFRAQRGDDKGGAGADVGNGDLCAAKPAWAVHDRMQASLDRYARTHLRQLSHVLEPVLVHELGDDALAFGLGHQRHVLRLEVGRETWKSPGGHIDRLQGRPA